MGRAVACTPRSEHIYTRKWTHSFEWCTAVQCCTAHTSTENGLNGQTSNLNATGLRAIHWIIDRAHAIPAVPIPITIIPDKCAWKHTHTHTTQHIARCICSAAQSLGTTSATGVRSTNGRVYLMRDRMHRYGDCRSCGASIITLLIPLFQLVSVSHRIRFASDPAKYDLMQTRLNRRPSTVSREE